MPPKCRPNVAAARVQTERMLTEAARAIGEMPVVHARPVDGLGDAEAGTGAPSLGATKKRPRVAKHGVRSAEHCAPRLVSARAAFAAAGNHVDPIKQRDAYVRAAFQAGQALACARVTQIGKKLGHMKETP